MTALGSAHQTIHDEVRRRSASDGALIAVFTDASRQVILSTAVSEGTRHVDELFLRHLVAMVSDVGVAAVVFAVVRASGKPTRVDKRLWRELSGRLAGAATELLDVVVIGEHTSWSAAASVRRSPALSAAPRSVGR